MTAFPSRRAVASRVPYSVAAAFIAGIAVDRASRERGYAHELAGERSQDCPPGLDMFSYYLGRAEARRYHGRQP